jgi:hypothetical protein
MLTVNFDRLNVISTGSVVMKIEAKVCFPRGPYFIRWQEVGLVFNLQQEIVRDLGTRALLAPESIISPS